MPSTKKVVALPLLFLLLNLSSSAAYRVPFCFTPGLVMFQQCRYHKFSFAGMTWNSHVSSGEQSVASPEECQQVCTDTNDCDTVTWYDGQASTRPYYCEMFIAPDPTSQLSCTNCTTGPKSCTCSGAFTCSLNSDYLVELIMEITSEIVCAELCFQSSECTFYTWFSLENQVLKDTCALLRGCSERKGSSTCKSGPSDCEYRDVLTQQYPLCYKVGSTWSEEMSKGMPNITSPYICQELCEQDPECRRFTWYNTVANPHQTFVNFIY